MKFILNKDTVELIDDKEKMNSGSVEYYEAEVEWDETWNDLIKEAVIVKSENNKLSDVGKYIGIPTNKIHIDQEIRGQYYIGFKGFLSEDNKKIYQISTNFVPKYFGLGAGEIETENQKLPTLTEWEIYIAQIQEMLKNSGGGAGGVVEETDPTVPQHVKNITEQDIEKWNNGTGGTGGTSDYNDLKNKPKINEIELEGNKTLDELGIQPKGDYASKEELANKASINDMTNYIEEHKEELRGPAGAVIQEEEPTDDTVIWVDPNEEGKVFEEETFKKEMETYCANYIDTQITQAIGGVY